MRIGFDAKRAFFNQSGLGNYSRNMIQYLANVFPKEEYFLFTPPIKGKNLFEVPGQAQIISPATKVERMFPSLWRSVSITNEISALNIDIFHGLSNELPLHIYNSKAKSVVTIHDLIFMRYPQWYKPIDRYIYKKKFHHACNNADKIIAISEQTKADIIYYFEINPDKISVVYQGCNPIFYEHVSDEKKKEISKKYHLPENYVLTVGTIEKRKNLLTLIKAMQNIKFPVPLVAVGRNTDYAREVRQYIDKNKLGNKVVILNDVKTEELPAVYQMSTIFVYPSIFEGFGIPVIEALNSEIPVITTQKGCFSEAGGKHSIYINPENPEEMGEAINKVLKDKNLRNTMIQNGRKHALNFREEKIANNLMKEYRTL